MRTASAQARRHILFCGYYDADRSLHIIQMNGYLLQYDVKMPESVYTGGLYGILMFNISLVCYCFLIFLIFQVSVREIVLQR